MGKIVTLVVLLFTQFALANTPPPGQARSVLVDQATNAPITNTVVGADRGLDVFSVNPVTAPQMCSIVQGGAVIDPRQTRPLTSSDVVTAQQGGTWNINNITGTIPLAPNACTESTLNSLNSKVTTTANGIRVDVGALSVVANPDSNTRDGAGNLITSTTDGPKRGLDVNIVNSSAGGATEATLSALNTKVTTTANGIKTDGSSVVQPISATALPLPANAATESTLNNLNGKIPTNGAKTSANSIPVVLATDQAAINVNIPGGIATEATLQGLNGKFRVYDTDSSGTTENVTGVNLRFTGPSGSTEAGTLANPFRIDPTGTTPQPITGSVTANIGSAGSVASEATLSQINTKTLTAGQKTMANSSPVVIANDQSPIPATQSGVWNINNITGTIPLPTGAATSANQTTINTTLQDSLPRKLQDGNGVPITSKVSGVSRALDVGVTVGGVHVDPRQVRNLTSGTDVVTAVQGGVWTINNTSVGSPNAAVPVGATQVAGSDGTNLRPLKTTNDGTLKVDLSGSTSPLPSGAATEAKQDVGNTTLSTINGKLNTLGQKNMAGSVPVTLASDQPAVPITGSITALNPSLGVNGSASPAQSTQVGGSDGTDLVPFKVLADGTVKVDGSDFTQPISAVALPLPSGAATSALQTTGNTTLGNIDDNQTNGTQKSIVRGGAKGLTTPSDVTSTSIDANTQALDVAVKGPITANIGTTAGLATEATLSALNTKVPANLTVTSNRLIVDGSSVTQPVSAAALPLPAGAATSALQTTGNSSLSAIDSDLDVALSTRASQATVSSIDTKIPANLTVTANRLQVDGSGVTQPISATALPLPSGAATATLQTTGNTSLGNIDTDVDVALSTRASESTLSTLNGKVVKADTDDVTITASALPSGAATSALQTAGNGSLSSIDTKLTDRTQKTQISNGTDEVAVTDAAPVGTEQGLVVRNIPSGTQNVTVTSAALPTGAATEATLSTINGKLNTLGQKTMANSMPVAIASDQSAVPASQSGTWNINNVSGTVSLPTGASTSALQTAGNGTLTSIDTKLTDGTQKAIARGGTKGTTTAGDVTSTNVDANTQALDVSVKGTAAVSVASLPLPSGAATEATLSALNTKVTAVNTGAVTISTALPTGTNSIGQVTANAGTNLNTSALNLESTQSAINAKIPANLTVTATRLLTDGSGVTQPISATALPLPTGAATSANQTTANGSLASIDAKTPALVSGRQPVDGSGVTQPISAAALPLPAGAATETTLAALNTKIPASPAQDRTTAAAPNANRLSDGTAFYDARQVRALTASDVVTTNAQKVATATLSSATNSNASFSVVASNANRTGLVLHNDSNTTCFYAFAATATTSAFTIRLTTQASYFMQAPIYTGAVSAICNANNGNTRATEL